MVLGNQFVGLVKLFFRSGFKILILLRDQETKSWKTSSQNSILFEIDGPYKVTQPVGEGWWRSNVCWQEMVKKCQTSQKCVRIY